VVIQAHDISTMKYVIFRNLSNPRRHGWTLTGSVTFYESPVDILDSKFLESRSEDALNIIRSHFKIARSLFRASFSDALDVDFGEGTITRSLFIESGNDAVDVSGSVVEMDRMFITAAKDKGISVGENSNVIINRTNISHSRIAIAGKDMSTVKGREVSITASAIGVAAYQEKPEYGPGAVELHDVQMKDVKVPYVSDQGSTIIVDGRKIESSGRDVQQVLYEVNYGKVIR